MIPQIIPLIKPQILPLRLYLLRDLLLSIGNIPADPLEEVGDCLHILWSGGVDGEEEEVVRVLRGDGDELVGAGGDGRVGWGGELGSGFLDEEVEGGGGGGLRIWEGEEGGEEGKQREEVGE